MTASDQAPVTMLERRRWIAFETDRIGREARASELGRRARRAYLDRMQIRNLVRIAETSQSSALLYDYVKVKVGRQAVWRREQFGRLLLDALQRLEEQPGPGGAPLSAAEHVLLCRVFLRQMAAAYLYSIVTDNAARAAGPASSSAAAQRETGRPGRQRLPSPALGEQTAPVAPPARAEVPAPEVSEAAPAAEAPVEDTTTELPEPGGEGPDVPMGDVESEVGSSTEEALSASAEAEPQQ